MTDLISDQIEKDELAKLQRAFHFTLTDGGRLLQKSDVEGICSSTELCFEYGNNVRCGPCAVKQAQKYGVTPDISQPFSPEEYRLRRRVRAAETEIGVLREVLQKVVDIHRNCHASPEIGQSLMGEVVNDYQDWADSEFDPTLISLSEDGRLSYAGVEYTLMEKSAEAMTIVRRVEQWAMENLTALPGGRWRVRQM
jgi:hypothetical protein